MIGKRAVAGFATDGTLRHLAGIQQHILRGVTRGDPVVTVVVEEAFVPRRVPTGLLYLISEVVVVRRGIPTSGTTSISGLSG